MSIDSKRASGVLVVGADGFIGRAFVRHLTTAGERVLTATGVDRVEPGGIRWGDALGVRTIVWAASTINPQIAELYPERVAADRRTVMEFVEAIDQSRHRPRLVVLSSGGTVYGESPSPHHEGSVTAPKGAYGAAKLRIEDDVRATYDRAVVLRLSNVYGPGQPRARGQGVLGHWLRDIRDAKPVRVIGALDAARDYIYIDDVVDLLHAVHGVEGDLPNIMNAGSGTPTSLGELLDVVGRVVAPTPFEVSMAPSRAFDVSATWLDVARVAHCLNWRTAVSIEDGVRRMWWWIRDEEGAVG